jgi:serine/threonine-protein kinase
MSPLESAQGEHFSFIVANLALPCYASLSRFDIPAGWAYGLGKLASSLSVHQVRAGLPPRRDDVPAMLSPEIGTEPYPGYRLGRPLGRGALGHVWQATDPHGEAVAIKFLPCANAFAAATEVRALQWVRQLRHPHLLRIHQIWANPGYVAIAMELAEGSLLDLLQVYYEESGGPMPAGHLCHYLSQAASALDFLNTRHHRLNGQRVAVRHCDVKPSNLLLLAGQVKLADFSLSVQTTAAWGYSRRMGTLEYAAPEVFQGWLSDRTDQYALAVTYCLLRGGRFPFPDPPSHFHRDYARPSPDLSMLSEVERPLLARALDPVPQDRWPSCLALMEQLTVAVKNL